ncbi:hypothetical protein BDF19DRAFT_431831 [Syncephalis fuscata]|nr:hypothetical protein BDF19DRAFT_431831 [Syncephalis fuscata]
MSTANSPLVTGLWDQLRNNPVNWVLVGLLAYLARAYFRRGATPLPKPLPHKPRVFETLTPVYDVTPGRNFYGPEGPYGNFAGHDASRGLAKGSFDLEMITPLDQPIDSLENLTTDEWEALNDWEGLSLENMTPAELEKRNSE